MKRVFLTICGTCLGPPGPGGWAFILRYGQYSIERSGGSSDTTKARMELQAILEAFKAIMEPCEVQCVSDNQWLLENVACRREERQLSCWSRLSAHLPDPLPDADLWKAIDSLTERHLLGVLCGRQLSGSIDVKRCEELAVAQVGLHGEAPRMSGLIDRAALATE